MDPSAFPTLDPELAPILELLPDMSGALDDLPAARAFLSSLIPAVVPEGIDELEVTDVPLASGAFVRTYRPRAATGSAGVPTAGLLHLHGGGFVMGDVEMEHAVCVRIARELQCTVASVDYRLAPEHPYPAGLEDCYAGLELLAGLDGVDPARLVVMGQSAGGGLAAATALLARDRGGPALSFQVLGIPELDDRLETDSMRAFTDTPMWSRPQAEASWRHYLGGQQADQYAAPARATSLAGLPPAYVVVCELDPLRDEGLAYARRLLAAGVSVELHCFPGAFHGAALVREAAVVRRMEAELDRVLTAALG